jgi:hypothetical protein
MQRFFKKEFDSKEYRSKKEFWGWRVVKCGERKKTSS